MEEVIAIIEEEQRQLEAEIRINGEVNYRLEVIKMKLKELEENK